MREWRKCCSSGKRSTPEKLDNDGRTPLSHAAGSKDTYIPSGRIERVVKMLLGREEVNPDKPDNDG